MPESTTNENKLILYGLYKQATVGDVNTSEYNALNVLCICTCCLKVATLCSYALSYGQAVLACSTWETEQSGMHGRLLKVCDLTTAFRLTSFHLVVWETQLIALHASMTGKSTDEAMNDYITKVKQLLEEAAASA